MVQEIMAEHPQEQEGGQTPEEDEPEEEDKEEDADFEDAGAISYGDDSGWRDICLFVFCF